MLYKFAKKRSILNLLSDYNFLNWSHQQRYSIHIYKYEINTQKILVKKALLMSHKHNRKLMDLLHTDVPAGLSKTTKDSATAIILDFQSIS